MNHTLPMSYSLIEKALGHPAKIRVLRELKKPGTGYMSINQLARSTSLNSVTLARTLRSLQDLGLTNYIQAGKSQLWRLSEGFVVGKVISPILDAMGKTPNLIEELKEVVLGLSLPSGVKKIILFGSVARNENEAGSDIDLCVIQSQDKSTLDPFLNELTEKISRNFWMNLSFLIKTDAEFKKMRPKLRTNILEGVVLYEKKPDKRGSKV